MKNAKIRIKEIRASQICKNMSCISFLISVRLRKKGKTNFKKGVGK